MHLIINFLIYFLIFTNSTLSLSLSHSRLSLSFIFFFSFVSAFLFGFGVLLTARFSFFSFFFFYTHTHTHTHTHIYIYIYIKVFMGSWKLLGWPVVIGMGEGGQAKNQRAQAFFMKILYTKKNKIWTQGGARAPFALCLGPSLLSTESGLSGFESVPCWMLIELIFVTTHMSLRDKTL